VRGPSARTLRKREAKERRAQQGEAMGGSSGNWNANGQANNMGTDSESCDVFFGYYIAIVPQQAPSWRRGSLASY